MAGGQACSLPLQNVWENKGIRDGLCVFLSLRENIVYTFFLM